MMEVILILYITVIVLLYTAMLVLMFNDKGQYIKLSCKALKEICAANVENGRDILLKEINRFYEEYSNENGKFRKNYPNVIKWLDAIIFRVDCGKASMAVLKEFIVEIKEVRDELEQRHPFIKCERYQQNILQDLKKIKTNENEIVIQNIIDRIQEEFLRLSSDIQKNKMLNTLSLIIGFVGILVSIILALINI